MGQKHQHILLLQCDEPCSYPPKKFVGQDYADCKRQAREAGWQFKKNGKISCPEHSGKKMHYAG